MLPFDTATGIELSVGFHHGVAALGMFALLYQRFGVVTQAALVAGLGFSFSGYLVSMDASLLYLYGLAWSPWVLWALDRLLDRSQLRILSLLTILLAVQLLAGDLQWSVSARPAPS
jgi:hypothetical protein